MMRYLVFFLASSLTFSAGVAADDIQATKHLESIVLGAGCFWGAEKRYAAIPGVIDAISGYA
ncbi:MAG: peptide-methionine (S)-S-oxide reductase, partial [Arenicellales bacterium]|nr:peptide-methionine (S)-S-oxide reductase [Arenicellales bacterium]